MVIKNDYFELCGAGFKRLDEASLGRILQHCKNGFLAISADRGIRLDADGNPLPEDEVRRINRQKSVELEKDIRAKGLGFISTYGGYGEDLADGSKNYVEDEESKFVPYRADLMSFDEFRDFGLYLAKKYEQDAVVVAEPVESDGEVKLNAAFWYHEPGSWTYQKGDQFNGVSLDAMPQYYSRLKKGSHNKVKFSYKESVSLDNLEFEIWGYRYPASPSGRKVLTMKGELLYCFSPKESVDRILNGESIKSVLA